MYMKVTSPAALVRIHSVRSVVIPSSLAMASAFLNMTLTRENAPSAARR